MDQLDALNAVVKREVAAYELPSPDARSFFVAKEAAQTYAVLVVPNDDSANAVVMMLAQVIGSKVVIWCDHTDNPLSDVLIAVGIARDQICLAYLGEPVPEAAPTAEPTF